MTVLDNRRRRTPALLQVGLILRTGSRVAPRSWCGIHDDRGQRIVRRRGQVTVVGWTCRHPT
jgi:hypothetical protein